MARRGSAWATKESAAARHVSRAYLDGQRPHVPKATPDFGTKDRILVPDNEREEADLWLGVIMSGKFGGVAVVIIVPGLGWVDAHFASCCSRVKGSWNNINNVVGSGENSWTITGRVIIEEMGNSNLKDGQQPFGIIHKE